tara:strand:+ start:871 stop:1020 length:150 start_codon:yes stop_codon:yes gene_type:complete
MKKENPTSNMETIIDSSNNGKLILKIDIKLPKIVENINKKIKKFFLNIK